MIPGLIDGHTHVAMTLFRGLADDLPLHTWLERHVWPAERRFIHPETVRWGSRLGVAELLRAGVTTLCDMYFYEHDVAAVADELGVRGVLGQAFFDYCRHQTSTRGILAYATSSSRAGGATGASCRRSRHTRPTPWAELYRRLHALAERLDVPCRHASRRDAGRGSRHPPPHGRSPVRHLASLGLVDAAWSPPTASGSTPRRSRSWQRAARAWCTIRAAT